MWQQKIKKNFWKHSRLYTIFCTTLVLSGILVVGDFYFQKQVIDANAQIQNNLQQANRIRLAIPIWHKKINTNQEIKIGMITDTHATTSYKRMLPVRNFVKEMLVYQPEFVINLGDVIKGSGKTEAEGIYETKFVDREVQKIGVPAYWVIGNHDLRAITKEDFKNIFELESLNYFFDVGDYRFVVLDGNFLPDDTPRSPYLEERYVRGHVSQEGLDFLKKSLETQKQTVVFIHQPPIVGDDLPQRSPGGLLDNADEIQEILEEYRVLAVFGGHIEYKRHFIKDNVNYYVLPGSKKSEAFPGAFYEMTIKNRDIDVEMYYKDELTNQYKTLDFENTKDKSGNDVVTSI